MKNQKINAAILLCSFVLASCAFGKDPFIGFLERTRTQFNRVELMACDLVDELIYEWKKDLPVAFGSSVYLAGIHAPYGLNSHFVAFVENHFFDLASSQLSREVKWTHCPSCMHLMVHSTPKRTVFGSFYDVGYDFSKNETNHSFDYGLFLDFSTENEKLILRSRIFEAKDQRIVSSKTIVTSSRTPPLLRPHMRLISQEEARQEYINLLKEKELSETSLRLTTKIFVGTDDGDDFKPAMPPMIWLEANKEYYLNVNRKSFAGMSLGISSLPRAYDAISVGLRGGFLIFKPFYSLVDPNLYFYFEGASQYIQGSGALLFMNKKRLRVDQLVGQMQDSDSSKHKVTLPFVRFGVETRIKNIFKASFFLEGFPTELDNENFGKKFAMFHSYGFECGIML